MPSVGANPSIKSKSIVPPVIEMAPVAISWSCLWRSPAAVPYAVGLYIVAAYWFTASTSFANPAVTIARALTGTFAGIAPAGDWR
jgi:glycerol uptake facilitator-like aquaporin